METPLFEGLGFNELPELESVEDDGDTDTEETERDREPVLPGPVTVHECVECGTEVFRTSGRGRWPKYCPDHKPTSRTGTPRTKKASKTTLNARLAELSKDVGSLLGFVGIMVSKPAPVTGVYIAEGAEEAGQEIVRLAKNSPVLLAALERASQVGPTVKLGKYAAGIVTALQVDTGRMAPDTMMARFTGVTDVAERLAANMNSRSQDMRNDGLFMYSEPPLIAGVAA